MRFEPVKPVERRLPNPIDADAVYALPDVAAKVNELVERVNALAELIENVCETNNLWDGS